MQQYCFNTYGKFLKYRLGDALTKVKYFDELLKYHPQIMRLLNKTQKSNIEQIGKNIVAVMKNPNHVDGFFRLLEDIKTADDQIVEAYSKLLLFMNIKDPVRSELIQTLNYPIYRKGLSIFDDFDRYLLLCFFQHNQNFSLIRLVLYSMCETDSERDRGNQLVKSAENYDESFLPRIDVLERITNALPKEEYIDKVLIHYQPIMRLINKVEASRRCQMVENIVGVITNIHLKVGFCQLIGAASDSEIEDYSRMFAAMHEDIEIAKELINMMKRAFYKFLGIIENGN